MKDKLFTIRENFCITDEKQRKKIIQKNIIKIISNQFEKDSMKNS